jgi:hypothetical protein
MLASSFRKLCEKLFACIAFYTSAIFLVVGTEVEVQQPSALLALQCVLLGCSIACLMMELAVVSFLDFLELYITFWSVLLVRSIFEP